MTDHAALAREELERGFYHLGVIKSPGTIEEKLRIAQVHATLAVAEAIERLVAVTTGRKP